MEFLNGFGPAIFPNWSVTNNCSPKMSAIIDHFALWAVVQRAKALYKTNNSALSFVIFKICAGLFIKREKCNYFTANFERPLALPTLIKHIVWFASKQTVSFNCDQLMVVCSTQILASTTATAANTSLLKWIHVFQIFSRLFQIVENVKCRRMSSSLYSS